MAVPHSTADLPPAFSARLPPMVQAQALVGSVAKTRPRFSASAIAVSVTTPASNSITAAVARLPSAPTNSRSLMPRMRSSRSVLTITQSEASGTAPPVSPVPAPRGMACRRSLAMAASKGATSASRSGRATASGRHRRQSVASVAWLTSANGSKLTFASPMTPPSTRRTRCRLRRAAARSRTTSARWARQVRIRCCTSAFVAGVALDDVEVAPGQGQKLAPAARGIDELLPEKRIAAQHEHVAHEAHQQTRRTAGHAPLA